VKHSNHLELIQANRVRVNTANALVIAHKHKSSSFNFCFHADYEQNQRSSCQQAAAENTVITSQAIILGLTWGSETGATTPLSGGITSRKVRLTF
jgi:hypothetical protein